MSQRQTKSENELTVRMWRDWRASAPRANQKPDADDDETGAGQTLQGGRRDKPCQLTAKQNCNQTAQHECRRRCDKDAGSIQVGVARKKHSGKLCLVSEFSKKNAQEHYEQAFHGILLAKGLGEFGGNCHCSLFNCHLSSKVLIHFLI